MANVFETYDLHTECLKKFLQEFSDPQLTNGPSTPYGSKKYLNKLQHVANGQLQSLEIFADDLLKFCLDQSSTSDKFSGLVDGVLLNTSRYLQLLYSAVDAVKNEYTPPTSGPSLLAPVRVANSMVQAAVPVNLRVPYEIHVVPPAAGPVYSPRYLRATHVGSLVKVDAVVVKATSVKPRVKVAAYRCNDCGASTFQAVEGQSYMPLVDCNAPSCIRNKNQGDLQFMIRESRFIKHQEVTIQEVSHQVPQGCIPRNLKVVVEGELTRRLSPGSSTTLGGVLLPVAKTGFAALRAGLVADTYFEVHHIETHKKGYSEDSGMSPEETAECQQQFENCDDLYEKLSRSIAPAICGHEDVKKAVLLQLVGGVTQVFKDRMKIRGDIHILLMGDPGVAKSQILRQICSIAPRAHYTTGKGASGVGLTASVTKDPITGEFTLEGGAIVLADNGICCIDEFDKMDESDRTAIHEVMEQQTVSVAKAGLTTTLNARTCILAAANPVYGRYDVNKSPVANMNLPVALLSRFDIQFLLLDRPDVSKDFELAKHILHVHRRGVGPDKAVESTFSPKAMRMFIAQARQYKPTVSSHLADEIVEHYVGLRSRERTERDRGIHRTCTTPRTLLGILRMAQALARLRRSNNVDRGDFEEALRLMLTSKDSVLTDGDGKPDDRKPRQLADYRTEIIEIVKELDVKQSRRVAGWNGWLSVAEDVEVAVQHQGYSLAQLRNTLEEYVELEVLSWQDAKQAAVAFVERLGA